MVETVSDVVRRLAVLSLEDRAAAVLEIEQAAASSGRVAVTNSAHDFPKESCSLHGQMVVVLGDSTNSQERTSFSEEITALGGVLVEDTGATLFPYLHPNSARRTSDLSLTFDSAPYHQFCSVAHLQKGFAPQVVVPTAGPMLDSVCRASASFDVKPGWLSIRDYHGGKRAFLKSGSALGKYLIGRYRKELQIDPNSVKRVVFFCMGNINRSAYAAAVMKAAEGIPAVSFGLSANNVDAASVQALERGARDNLNLSNHVTTALEGYLPLPGDLLAAFEPEHLAIIKGHMEERCEELQFTLLGLWSKPVSPYIQDPILRSEAYIERCFDLIESAVKSLALHLKSAATHRSSTS